MDSAERLIEDLRAATLKVLGARLMGLYVYGSLAGADFDPDVSDVDLLAVTAGPLSWLHILKLGAMQAAFEEAHPEWTDRIEVQYLADRDVEHPSRPTGLIGVLRPGHEFHTETGADRLLDLYQVREAQRAVLGPDPAEIIPVISRSELQTHNMAELDAWPEYVTAAQDLEFQAHLILTICRKLYTAREGKLVSKPAAAEWACRYMADRAETIRWALDWRRGLTAGVDAAATYPETLKFVREVTEEIRATPTGAV